MWRRIVAVAAWAAGISPALLAQELPLWGGLEPGSHAVGFESRWELDHGRTYDTVFADGTHYAAGKASRPILVNVWYPAQPVGEPETMSHGEYLDIGSDDPRLARLALALTRYAHGVLIEWMMGRSHPDAMDDWDHAELERILALPTASIRDATPARGRFPLVVFHSGYGSSFEDNAVFCEYLASHGYVVVGSAFLDETGETFNVDAVDGSSRDFAFLIRAFEKAPNVDWNKIAVAGHSAGAQASLRFNTEPRAAIDAVISLDTTEDYVSALDPHWSHSEKMLEDVTGQTAPILAVANSYALFDTCDELVHAERYYLTFRELGHNDYTSQGILTAEVAARRAVAQAKPDARELTELAQRLRTGFEQCCAYALLFLDAYLKEEAQAIDELAARYRTHPLAGEEPHVEYVPKGASAPPPFDEQSGRAPSPRQVFHGIGTMGAPEWLERLERLHAEDPGAPVFESQFAYALLFDLVARGRPEDAALLAPFYRELHPGLVRTFTVWLDRSGADTYREYRLHALTAALLLEPENEELKKRLADQRAE